MSKLVAVVGPDGKPTTKWLADNEPIERYPDTSEPLTMAVAASGEPVRRHPRRPKAQKRRITVSAFGGPETTVEIDVYPRQKDVWRPNALKMLTYGRPVVCCVCRRGHGTLKAHKQPDGTKQHIHPACEVRR